MTSEGVVNVDDYGNTDITLPLSSQGEGVPPGLPVTVGANSSYIRPRQGGGESLPDFILLSIVFRQMTKYYFIHVNVSVTDMKAILATRNMWLSKLKNLTDSFFFLSQYCYFFSYLFFS